MKKLLLVLALYLTSWSCLGQASVDELNRQLEELLRQDRSAEALLVAQQLVHESETVYGPEDTRTATSLSNLAMRYESMGRFEEALALYKRALAIDEKSSGAEDLDVAFDLNNIAELFLAMGRYEDALPLYQRALAIIEKTLDMDHPDVAVALNKLAGLYRTLGRYEEALPLCQRVVTIAEDVFGPQHPDTATSLNNLASLYRALGRYEDALPLYQRALKIDDEGEREESPGTAIDLNNLAGLYKEMGRYEDALLLYHRALAIKVKVLGDKHASTALSLSNLAGLYESMGRYADALPLYQRALAINEILGVHRPDTAISLNNLASLYESMGRHQDALPLYWRALTINEENFKTEHPSTAAILSNLAGLLESMGRYEDALPLYRRALSINEKALGSEHPLTAVSLNNLGKLYKETGRYEDALLLLRRALRIVSVSDITDLSREHGAIEYLAKVSANLAWYLEKHVGDAAWDEAIFYFKLSVNTRQRLRAGAKGLDQATRDSLTRQLAAPYHELSRLLIQRGRLAEAERVLFLLKESELTEFLRRNGGAGGELATLNWTPEEEGYKQVLNQLALQWREFEQQRAAVLERVKRGQVAQDAPEVTGLEAQRGQLDARTGNLMAEAASRFTEASRKAQEARQKGFELAHTALSDKLAEIAKDAPGALRTAGLVLLPDERGLMLLVTTARGTAPLLQKISEAKLNQFAAELRQAILERKDYKAPARALYDALIAPAEAQLGEQAGIQQWAILPFGALRNLPFAALIGPDGRHLIERYALVQLTADGSGRFAGLEKATRPRWQGVAMGASQADPAFGNLGLPGVRREVCGVVRDATECPEGKGVVAGHAYLDPRFTPARLRHYLGPEAGEANFLHIATHFKTEKSMLLLGDGEKLTPSQILAWNPRLGQYDLLALSACDSGVDAGAVESLGGLFRSKGAKAVLGTLWPVADVGAAPLMVEFYRRRGEQRALGKAEALRQAQVEMLNGRLRAEDGKTNMSHPYFWAPYVLMGNWL